MCAAGHRLRPQQEGPQSRRKQADWREDPLQIAKPCVGARSQNHPESGNGGHPDKDARADCRGVVSFRGAGTLARKSRGPRGCWTCSRRQVEASWPRRQHHEAPAGHDPACEPEPEPCPSVRRGKEGFNVPVLCRACCSVVSFSHR